MNNRVRGLTERMLAGLGNLLIWRGSLHIWAWKSPHLAWKYPHPGLDISSSSLDTLTCCLWMTGREKQDTIAAVGPINRPSTWPYEICAETCELPNSGFACVNFAYGGIRNRRCVYARLWVCNLWEQARRDGIGARPARCIEHAQNSSIGCCI